MDVARRLGRREAVEELSGAYAEACELAGRVEDAFSASETDVLEGEVLRRRWAIWARCSRLLQKTSLRQRSRTGTNHTRPGAFTAHQLASAELLNDAAITPFLPRLSVRGHTTVAQVLADLEGPR